MRHPTSAASLQPACSISLRSGEAVPAPPCTIMAIGINMISLNELICENCITKSWVLPCNPCWGVIPVGAREDDVGLGGPLWSPASSSSGFHLGETRLPPHPAGDPKGPPSPASASLAPTDVDGGVLTSITWLSTIILNLR